MNECWSLHPPSGSDELLVCEADPSVYSWISSIGVGSMVGPEVVSLGGAVSSGSSSSEVAG